MFNFIKMHGTSNDFVIIDNRASINNINNIEYAKIAHRKTGIGCDQVIVIDKSSNADCFMHIYNSDGSKVEMCGNGARCVAYLLMQEKKAKSVSIETTERIIYGSQISNDLIQINMGTPKFHWKDIPISQPCDTLNLPIAIEMLEHPVGVNIGNPHIVFFVQSVNSVPLDRLGVKLENHPLLPNKANIGIVEIISQDHIKLRVWERGVGETSSCGSGACAAVVAAIRRKYTKNTVLVTLQGGDLLIYWKENNSILISGTVNYVFCGTYR
ncbi:diaminopimelate epimerase [Neoehrlichia mikurensis]|uniref:Diaminopimelate epimerase n=1 Tax=Neoehrlichia mikurensis TaxID=89586 RepID=A0A9Q9BWD2_9RICK|nr:diaminopimelate epimerase [Neoehrlichia mikurensis]QXK92304.1 diaminopimelate epimerase [Neoehrlichia mikurensis]QXK92758.1 diaminopimelate epimerase [Neoehrlichia mikurensis]QXK93999.1 diaminopimelate epimerase [Neoehrlichia mikurensis]UTO55838.1 diaminopimelate epimerase [Neoehrlichia mikurensis]UTO56753.1 diaminopimelate epimerase [Neoehrlichia mikurensis]